MGKLTALQARDHLRTDLNDSGVLWSDPELDRSVGRAVSDLSRMLPLEKIYEKVLKFTVTGETFTTPKDTDIDYIVTNQTLNGKSAGDKFTLTGTQPDYPRVLTVLITDANDGITNWSIIIKGVDVNDKAIEETFHFGSGKSQTGKVEFKYVREVELDQVAGTLEAADVIDIGIGAYTDVWVTLANKRIKWASETIVGTGDTSTTRNTDYYMDYANGRVKVIASAELAAIEACTIGYTIGQLWVDLTSIEDLIRVEKAIYPAGEVPQNVIQTDIWGNIVVVTGMGEADEQSELAEDKHIVIFYSAQHQPPTAFSPGTYPNFLEDTVLLAAGAYALFQYVLKWEHQAATDFASARTALGNTGAIHTLIATALGEVVTYTSDMNVALDAAVVQVAAASTALAKINNDSGRTYLSDADGALDAAATQSAAAATALGKINDDSTRTYITDADAALDAYVTAIADAATALGKVDTYLAGATNSTKALLAKIATDVTNLRTAIVTATDAANTALDGISFSDVDTYLGNAVTALAKVTTYLESNTNEDSKAWLTKITTDIADLRTKMATALDAVATYTTGSTAPSAKKYLDDGDALIDKSNKGTNVAENYASYANTCVTLVTGLISEASVRLANLRSYIEQAGGWSKIASGFVEEAEQEVSMAGQAANRERAKVDQATGYLTEANVRLASLRTYIEQANEYSTISGGFIAEAEQQVARAMSFIAEAERRLAIADRYIAEASQRTASSAAYSAEATQRMAIADRYIAEAAERVASANAYVAEANSRYAMCRAFIEEAGGRLNQIEKHIDEASQYNQIAAQNQTLADRFRADAIERRNEAWSVWRDRKQYIGDYSQSSVRQMPQYNT